MKLKKLILFVHVSLDGFAASTDGELDWAHVDDELFGFAAMATANADTALYGRNTFGIMQAYWPAAGDKPGASRHDRQHSAWFNSVRKYVISNTMASGTFPGVNVIGGNAAERVRELKKGQGSDILMLGSPTAAHALMKADLIDEYRLFVNQVILGGGIPLFCDLKARMGLKLLGADIFSSGVAGLHYKKI